MVIGIDHRGAVFVPIERLAARRRRIDTAHVHGKARHSVDAVTGGENDARRDQNGGASERGPRGGARVEQGGFGIGRRLDSVDDRFDGRRSAFGLCGFGRIDRVDRTRAERQRYHPKRGSGAHPAILAHLACVSRVSHPENERALESLRPIAQGLPVDPANRADHPTPSFERSYIEIASQEPY